MISAWILMTWIPAGIIAGMIFQRYMQMPNLARLHVLFALTGWAGLIAAVAIFFLGKRQEKPLAQPIESQNPSLPEREKEVPK